MLLECHPDVPTQEKGCVRDNLCFEIPRVAGCQLALREGQDCCSSALKWMCVHLH